MKHAGRTRTSLPIQLVLTKIALFLCFNGAGGIANMANGQSLTLKQTVPAHNSIVAGFNEPIKLKFKEEITLADFDISDFTIYGEYNGRYSIDIDALDILKDDDGYTLSIAVKPDFIEGENITFLMRKNVIVPNFGEVNPFRMAFRVRNRAGILTNNPGHIDIQLLLGEMGLLRMTAGKFNDDSYPDLAVLNAGSTHVTILLYDPISRTFNPNPPITVPKHRGVENQSPSDIASGDFNGDKYIDLIVPFRVPGKIFVLYGDGSGGFDPQVLQIGGKFDFGNNLSELIVGHFDGDDLLDFAIASLASKGVVDVYINDGNGANDLAKFKLFNTLNTSSQAEIVGVVYGDFEGDGDVDFAAIQSEAKSITYWRKAKLGGYGKGDVFPLNLPPARIALGNIFRAPQSGNEPDGEEIIVFSNFTAAGLAKQKDDDSQLAIGELTILEWEPFGQDSGRFVEPLPPREFPFEISALNLCSINGEAVEPQLDRNHALDILFANTTDNSIDYAVDLEKELPGGSFESPALRDPSDILTADFNLDGVDDVVYLSRTTNTVRFFRSHCPAPALFSVDFGDVFVNQTKEIKTKISLENHADISVKLEWANRDHFDITPTEFTLAPEEEKELTITFKPDAPGPFSTDVEILILNEENDCASRISVTGRGITVSFDVSPEICEFPATPPNSVSNCVLVVTNDGNTDLILHDFDILNKTPEFKVFDEETQLLNTDSLSVPANSSRELIVKFYPTNIGTFEDKLSIDSNHPVIQPREIVLIGVSTTNELFFCGPDTVEAKEDLHFCLRIKKGNCDEVVVEDPDSGRCNIGIFYDPDNETLEFEYLNLPNWLSVENDFLTGTPLEGDESTTITVIAFKEFVRDTQDIFINVIPVNDRPTIDNLPEIVCVDEGEKAPFTVIASDKEETPLEFFMEPPPKNLCGDEPNIDRETGEFCWTPGFGCAGNHEFRIYVRENHGSDGPPGLESVTKTLTICVERLVPDLKADTLRFYYGNVEIAPHEIFINQEIDIVVYYRVLETPIFPVPDDKSFDIELEAAGKRHEPFTDDSGVEVVDEPKTLTFTQEFNEVGKFTVRVHVDVSNNFDEDDEDNNIFSVPIEVSPGKVVVKNNPFTPNGDDINDEVIFFLGQLSVNESELTIFNLSGRMVRKMQSQSRQEITWDGRDSNGVDQLPGVYIFILNSGKTRLDQGYVTLAR